jgi:hypothetical protein
MIENLVNNGRRRYRLRYEMPQVISFVARPSTITNHPSSNPRRRRPTESQWRLTLRGFRTGRPPRSSHHTAHLLHNASLSCPLSAGWDEAPRRSRRGAEPEALFVTRCGLALRSSFQARVPLGAANGSRAGPLLPGPHRPPPGDDGSHTPAPSRIHRRRPRPEHGGERAEGYLSSRGWGGGSTPTRSPHNLEAQLGAPDPRRAAHDA